MSTAPDAPERSDALAFRPSRREPCPEGSVPLHQLCDNCTRFFETWELMDWFANASPRNSPPRELHKKYDLCTLKHLNSEENCHFCMMISISLSGTKGLDLDAMIRLLPEYNYTDELRISICIQGKDPGPNCLALGNYCSTSNFPRRSSQASS
jgi:hypothetical protein